MTFDELNIFLTTLFIIVGTCFGSFFNVLIYRLPREKSLIHPGSSCPHCGHKIRWFENIPVLSYLFLGGRCSSCKAGISVRYPLVEIATGAISLLIYMLYIKPLVLANSIIPMEIPAMVAIYFTLLLIVPISMIDFEHYIIPDRFTIGGVIIGALISLLPGGITPLEALYGVLAGGGSLWLIGTVGAFVFKKEAMGGGDVKMLAWFGSLFGWAIAMGSIFMGAFVGLIIALFQYILGKGNDEHHVPFGPALYGGLLIAFFWGEEVWHWYATTILNLHQ